jgi:Ras of Complex, Roc, domain of DAPkinase/Ankyrin repeats (3 copies)
LTELVIQHSKLALSTARKICGALATNHYVTVLDLHQTQLGDDGGFILADLLRVNTTLTKLDLHHNEFSTHATRVLIEAAVENVTLQSLAIHHNEAGEDCVPSICNLMRTNSFLRSFSVDCMQFSPGAIRMIHTSLQHNFAMEHIEFFPQTPREFLMVTKRNLRMHENALLQMICFGSSNEVADQLATKAGKKLINKRVEGWTPLHVAASRGDFMILNTLVENGAKINADSSESKDETHTAFDIGIAKANTVIVDLLKPHGAKSKARYLDMSGMKSLTLEQLEHVLPECTNVEELNIEYTGLHAFPNAILDMPKLVVAYAVQGNPLSTVPREVRERNTDGLRRYLAGLKEQAALWTEVKLVFLGDGGVGKTSLIEAFQNPRGRMASEKGEHGGLATDGIAMSQWSPQFPLVSPSGESTMGTFNCWDFAGQAVFYQTHEFFLSEKASYVIVFNLCKGPERVVYWLRFGNRVTVFLCRVQRGVRPDTFGDSPGKSRCSAVLRAHLPSFWLGRTWISSRECQSRNR